MSPHSMTDLDSLLLLNYQLYLPITLSLVLTTVSLYHYSQKSVPYLLSLLLIYVLRPTTLYSYLTESYLFNLLFQPAISLVSLIQLIYPGCS